MRWPTPAPFNRICSCCEAHLPRIFGRGMAKKGVPRFRLCPFCDLMQKPKPWWPAAADVAPDIQPEEG